MRRKGNFFGLWRSRKREEIPPATTCLTYFRAIVIVVLKSWTHFPSLPQEQGIASGYCLTDDGEVELDVLGGGVAVVNAATVDALVLGEK